MEQNNDKLHYSSRHNKLAFIIQNQKNAEIKNLK